MRSEKPRSLAGFRGGRARRKAGSRRALSGLAALGLAFLAVPAAVEMPPILVWNASASVPIGLYFVRGTAGIARGGLVLAELPEPMRGLADVRGYLRLGVKLVKRVAAVPGDHVCTIGRAILIEGRIAARRLKRDSLGRVLPYWQGCGRLKESAFLLLMTEVPDSFDGRYFGPTRREDILGALTPIWIRAEGQQ